MMEAHPLGVASHHGIKPN